MKFARYLQDAQIPEWKNAYIDYHGLEVQLRAIQAKASQQVDTLRSSAHTVVDHTARNEGKSEEAHVDRGNITSTCITGLPLSETDPTTNCSADSDDHGPASPTKRGMCHHETLPVFNDPVLTGSPTPSALHTILSNLPAIHAKFFDMLDAELAKVETFYSERESYMYKHEKLLRKQLHELGIHRQMFYESSTHSKAQSWAKRAYISASSAFSSLIRFSNPKTKPKRHRRTDRNGIVVPELKHGGRGFANTSLLRLENGRLSVHHSGIWREDGVTKGAAKKDYTLEAPDDFIRARVQCSDTLPDQPVGGTMHPFDPQEYQQAKRQLRKAVSEHHRGLEALNNYRVLNLAAFRKALRKYGKIANISVLDAYMKERVEPSTFASGALVSTMLKGIDHLFAMRFERGGRKKVVDRLRVGSLLKTYHLSTFRSAWWLGLALPAIVAGCYLSFQEYTRRTLPSWNILVFIYSVLVIPVLMAVLIGINIVAWAHNRINYVFIFELNPRSRLDYHEYFELPSFLLCTLAYAFWFSLAQIGPPMLWPLIWLIFTFVVMFNPFLNFTWGRARWWMIKKIAKLGTSGMWEVEFTDVWLGDLMCSLVYSFSGLYFVGCFYTHFSLSSPSSTLDPSIYPGPSLYSSFPVNFTIPHQAESSTSNSAFQSLLASAYDPQAQNAWSTCGAANNWGWYCLLSSLPFLVRFVQCLKRYRDTKISAQLLNAGKYGMGIIYLFFYYYWRHQMDAGKSYVLWCFMATLNSMYGYAWDVLMDWSMCRPHARYPFLRSELVYSSHIPYYYFALASNLCIRFIWLTYVFLNGANFEQGVFIAGLLEMLRRVQWNFFRLENKHLNNMNLYRVTREVPLPYKHIVDAHDKEARAHEQLRKRLARLS